MRLLTRYVFFEFCKVFLTALGALTLLFLIVGVVKEALERGLGLGQVLPLIPYLLPNALLFTVPGTSLLAVCLVYGRMSGTNEVVALKSLGISPMDIIKPCLAAGFLLSLVTVWLNDVAWSWGFHGVQRVVLEAGEEIAYSMLRTQKSYSAGGKFSINVKRVEGRRLIRPTIVFHEGDSGRDVVIRADWAELKSNLKDEVLTITCHNSTVDVNGKVSVRYPGILEREIPLAELRRRKDADSAQSPSHMTLGELKTALVDQEAQLVQIQQELAASAAYHMLTGDFDSLASKEWQSEDFRLQTQRVLVFRLRTEPYRRWANGFSCLCFVLIGAPVAIRLRNADMLTSFFACFLPILCVYYPLFTFGMDRAKFGALPPYSVWLGNIILAACGYWILRKVIRY